MRQDAISDFRQPPVFLLATDSLAIPIPMTTSPSSVSAQFREVNIAVLTVDKREYEEKLLEFKQEVVHQNALKIITAERVEKMSWELRATKDAVLVMTRLLPNAKA
jgi:hypothetical protein